MGRGPQWLKRFSSIVFGRLFYGFLSFFLSLLIFFIGF